MRIRLRAFTRLIGQIGDLTLTNALGKLVAHIGFGLLRQFLIGRLVAGASRR
ncbi:MAG TPA: hypothetical protein VFB45_05545 [Pseudolabrys sp.]|nr:hypothetical protein [Pseudolabrys sp.]